MTKIHFADGIMACSIVTLLPGTQYCCEKTAATPVEYPPLNANKVGLQDFQLGNCMKKHGRSGVSPESESCQGRQMVVIHPWGGKLHRSSSTSQEELQSDRYEFGLPARDKAPER